MKRSSVLIGALVGALAASTAFAQPSMSGNMSLGTVHIAKPVKANGEKLPVGTYQVRLTNDAPEAKPGQAAGAEKYVEFVRGGKTVAREVATVVSAEDISKIAKGAKPKPGTSKFEMLKGGDYFRVWINKAGTHYLINLPPDA